MLYIIISHKNIKSNIFLGACSHKLKKQFYSLSLLKFSRKKPYNFDTDTYLTYKNKKKPYRTRLLNKKQAPLLRYKFVS